MRQTTPMTRPFSSRPVDRTVTFTIPAGQTQAVFPMTPWAPNRNHGRHDHADDCAAGRRRSNQLQLPVDSNDHRSAFRARSQRGPCHTNATGFNVVVTGFSTTREITQGTFRFAGTTNLQTTELTVALTAIFNTYFQGATARRLRRTIHAHDTVHDPGRYSNVNSVTVVLTNAVGSSQPVTATF